MSVTLRPFRPVPTTSAGRRVVVVASSSSPPPPILLGQGSSEAREGGRLQGLEGLGQQRGWGCSGA